MKRADEMASMKHVDKKALISASREVVQTADDSREIAMKRIDADRVNSDKNIEAAKLANAQASTKSEMQARMDAESATADANRRRADADKAAAEAQRLQQNAQAESAMNRTVAIDANQTAAEAMQAQKDAGSAIAEQESPRRGHLRPATQTSSCGSRRTARQVAETIQPHFCHARHRPRSYCELVGRFV